MQIVITGVCGMIGSHVCDSLLSDGHTVYGIDDLSFGNISNINEAKDNKNFHFFKRKVQDGLSFLLEYERIDLLCHFASYKKAPHGAISSFDAMKNNAEMMICIGQFVSQFNIPLLYTSSSDVYGDSETFYEDDAIYAGCTNIERHSYAMSKIHDEQMIFNLKLCHDIKCCVLRLFGCFSERSSTGWSGGHVPIFINNAIHNNDIIIHGNGTQTRSMTHAEDIIPYIKHCCYNMNIVSGEIINLGTNEEISVIDSAKIIIKECKSSSKIKHINYSVIDANYKEIQRRFANLIKAQRILGYKPKMKFVDGVRKVIKIWKNKFN